MMTYSEVKEKARNTYFQAVGALGKDRFRVAYVFSFFILLFVVSYMTIEKTPSLDDHFFHIRFAATIAEKGWGAFSDFKSIYFSKMGIGHEYLVYYNFLFYLALIPFSFLTPLVVGIKLYGVVALSASFTVVYWFLKKVAVRYPFVWTLVFYAALMQSGWLPRFLMARPFTLAPVFLIVMLYAVHARKYKTSAAIAFAYFFWHTATFMFPLCLAVGYVVFELFYGKTFDGKKIVSPLLGTAAAVLLTYVFFPGVIGYLRDVIFPVFFDTTFSKNSGIVEGNEVYGRDFFSLLKAFFGFLAALTVLGSYEIFLYVRTKRGTDKEEERIDPDIQPLRATLFMASITFLAVSTLSGRFLDYFVYFCLLYVAIAATDAVRFVSVRGEAFRKAASVGALIAFSYLFVSLTLDFSTGIASSQSHELSQAPAEWLIGNVEEGKVVFNSSWNLFPTLYYFTGDRFRYVNGLEPRFLYDLNPRLFWTWSHIGSDGIYCAERDCTAETDKRQEHFKSGESGKQAWYTDQGNKIADSVMKDFESEIVVVPIGQKNLLDVMDHSDRFKKEYFETDDSMCGVYRVVGRMK